ncbi:MAG: OmpA family protein [Candidatus Kapaibacterium sp.]
MKYFFGILFLVLVVPTFSQLLIFDQNFDGSVAPKNLLVGLTEEKEGKVENGIYLFKSFSDNITPFSTELLNIGDLDSSNYTIEVKIRLKEGREKDEFGLVFNANDENDDYYLFAVSDHGIYRIVSCKDGEYNLPKVWSKTKHWNTGGWNTLKIERKNYIARYYLNDRNVFNDFYFNPKGYNCGFFLNEKNQEMEVGYLKFWKSKKTINLIESPLVDVKKTVLSELNSRTDELSPVISSDGNSLYFIREGHPNHVGIKKNQDIWHSKYINDKWEVPELLGKPLNNDESNAVISISQDNSSMYIANLYGSDGEYKGFGMSVTERKLDGWSIPKQVIIQGLNNRNPYVSYFVSNDKQILLTALETNSSKGELDLYVSKLISDGSYSEPENLGAIVNTFANDFKPFLAADNKTLYYISEGLPGYGREDVWVTKRLDDTWLNWSEPKNLGSSINSSNSETAFVLTAKGDEAYMISYEKLEGSQGAGDIVKVQLSKSAQPDPVVLVYGKVLNKKTNEPIAANIEYFGLKDDKNYGNATSNAETGEYKIILPRGVNYGFKSGADGFISVPENLGSTINTFADDFKPFLAADNTTLYYISEGLPGYGREDVWVTKRLDDTWLNWSEPKNLGSSINSSNSETAFVLTAKGDEAYMVTYEGLEGYEGGSDIVKIELSKSVQPDPVVLVYGEVLNKKTNEPIAASIEYFGLKDDKNYGNATSNAETGEYKIILPRGVNYGFKSSTKGFISVSENLDLTELKEYKEIEKNLYLVPVEIGQTIRLNNIFFDTGLAILREESENELENLKKLLSDNGKMTIEVSGHTDNVGNDANNMKLSSDRAQAVVQWLLDKGINTSRLTSKGYGETKPVGSNSTEEGKQLNRRVEFTIITQ